MPPCKARLHARSLPQTQPRIPARCGRPAGSASHPPALSGGSAASLAACAEPAILVSKVLTYSDVSTEVARTGRIVLPRIQVQQCLPDLLRLCRAEHALPAVRNGGPVKLSVDLVSMRSSCCCVLMLVAQWRLQAVAMRGPHACRQACDCRCGHIAPRDACMHACIACTTMITPRHKSCPPTQSSPSNLRPSLAPPPPLHHRWLTMRPAAPGPS